eukprot:Skav220425  [mRNA]  locus=scaffold639:736005:751228:+ [translate_table: standard]
MALARLLHTPTFQVPLLLDAPCGAAASDETRWSKWGPTFYSTVGAVGAGLVLGRASSFNASLRLRRPAKAGDGTARGKVVVPMRRQNVVRPKKEESKKEEETSEPKTWASQADTPHPQRCDALCLADDLDLERVCSAWLGSAEQGRVRGHGEGWVIGRQLKVS